MILSYKPFTKLNSEFIKNLLKNLMKKIKVNTLK